MKYSEQISKISNSSTKVLEERLNQINTIDDLSDTYLIREYNMITRELKNREIKENTKR